jgi:hypothetical protein
MATVERTNSTVSSTSTHRRKKNNKKLLRYSVKALVQFVLAATTLFISLAMVGFSVQAYKFFAKGNPNFNVFSWLSASKKSVSHLGSPYFFRVT